MMRINCGGNLAAVRLGKSEIVLLPRGVSHVEHEEFSPIEHSLVNFISIFNLE